MASGNALGASVTGLLGTADSVKGVLGDAALGKLAFGVTIVLLVDAAVTGSVGGGVFKSIGTVRAGSVAGKTVGATTSLTTADSAIADSVTSGVVVGVFAPKYCIAHQIPKPAISAKPIHIKPGSLDGSLLEIVMCVEGSKVSACGALSGEILLNASISGAGSILSSLA